MDLFEKIGEVAKNLSEKAGDSLEINRLNGEISIEKGNIQCYQRELGEYYWAKFATGEKLDDEAMLICDKIVVSQDRMRALDLQIEKIKSEREQILEERTKGKELFVQSDQPEPNLDGQPTSSVKNIFDEDLPEEKIVRPLFCYNCGGGIKEGQRFCIFCGAETK
ncbi:hypothetical protein [Anaerotignum sp.]|uniref:hypothetical protein n=1 Tax=Anaerotignum sp. TaxID=2039241 RepID=UPI0033255F3E